MNTILKFPNNFLWGTATSSHQVEGDNFHNDWRKWERETAGDKSREAKLKNWRQDFLNLKPSPLENENYISGRACDHYRLFEQDFDLIKKLNNNAYRFSIEWSRIEPEDGEFSQKEIEHYKKMVAALKRRGITPFGTLCHFTLPLWFSLKGGWINKNAPEYFERYVGKIAESFGNEIGFWITINEPLVYASHSYFSAQWPPQEKNILKTIAIIKNLIKAHKKAYAVIHNFNKSARVGIAKEVSYFEAYKNKFLNRTLSWLFDYFWNRYFLDKIKDFQDFIGINFYRSDIIDYPKNRFNQNKNKEVSDLGWEICPEGIYHILKKLKNYKKPVYITENGIADAGGGKRTKFIIDHLKWTHKAIEEGADVRGYFYWSLLDNFEWDKGFWPRFGLVEVDYETLGRKPRQSFYDYAKICEDNAITD